MHHLKVCTFQSISLHARLILALKVEDHLCLGSGFFVKDVNGRFAGSFTFLNQSCHEGCKTVHLVLKRQDLLLGLSYQIQQFIVSSCRLSGGVTATFLLGARA